MLECLSGTTSSLGSFRGGDFAGWDEMIWVPEPVTPVCPVTPPPPPPPPLPPPVPADRCGKLRGLLWWTAGLPGTWSPMAVDFSGNTGNGRGLSTYSLRFRGPDLTCANVTMACVLVESGGGRVRRDDVRIPKAGAWTSRTRGIGDAHPLGVGLISIGSAKKQG